MLEAFFPAATLLELFFAAPLRAAVLFDAAFLEDAPVALLDAALERADVPLAAFFEAPGFFAAADLEVLDTPDLLPLDRERPCLPLPAALSSAVSALTSLLKLLFWPPAVSS
jgi:hypothetical protein